MSLLELISELTELGWELKESAGEYRAILPGVHKGQCKTRWRANLADMLKDGLTNRKI